MKWNLKSTLLAASLLVLSAFGIAQAFTNNYFDATFVGTVTSATSRNTANTSTNYDFTASDTNIFQDIDVRLVDHDIAMDYSSTDFYADIDARRGEVLARSTGVYQGHPFTYICVKYTDGGSVLTERDRYIMIGPREVYFITQRSLASYDDKAQWDAFESSLNIRR